VKPGKQEQGEGRQVERPGDQANAASEPKLVGEGWLTVVVAKTSEPGKASKPGKPGDPAAGSGEFGAIVQSLPKVSGSWGSGRVLKGSLFTVLFTDDGRVLAGAVAPERLYSVAGSTR
jgi:hypothetical protein